MENPRADSNAGVPIFCNLARAQGIRDMKQYITPNCNIFCNHLMGDLFFWLDRHAFPRCHSIVLEIATDW